MMAGSVLPWLLERDGFGSRALATAHFHHHHPTQTRPFCARPFYERAGAPPVTQLVACYQAVVLACDGEDHVRNKRVRKRLELPVPSAALGVRKLIIDPRLPRRHAREAPNLLVLPEPFSSPLCAAFALRHRDSQCLHPALAPLFAPLLSRKDVGLESPRGCVRRTFSECLRAAACALDASAAAADADGGGSSVQAMFELIGELYECSPDPASSPASAATVDGGGGDSAGLPGDLSSDDHWCLLLWAAVACAAHSHRMQRTASAEDASRYQELLSSVRRLVPFVESLPDGGGERWCFLAERYRAGGLAVATTPPAGGAEAAAPAPHAAVLLLRTLFGFDLWGSLRGIELRGQPPASTAVLPASILSRCDGAAAPPLLAFPAEGPRVQLSCCFAERFDRASLLLAFEWFLLEVPHKTILELRFSQN